MPLRQPCNKAHLPAQFDQGGFKIVLKTFSSTGKQTNKKNPDIFIDHFWTLDQFKEFIEAYWLKAMDYVLKLKSLSKLKSYNVYFRYRG